MEFYVYKIIIIRYSIIADVYIQYDFLIYSITDIFCRKALAMKKLIIISIITLPLVLFTACQGIGAVDPLNGTPMSSQEASQTPGPPDDGAERLILNAGDDFGCFKVYNEGGNAVKVSDIPGENRIVFYARSTCGDCQDEFENYSTLFKLYDSERTNLFFIWDGDIPYGYLEDMGISPGNSYATNGLIKFNNWVPTYFVLDAGDQIQFKTIEMGELAAYFNENFKAAHENLQSYANGRILMFSTQDCKGCASAYDELEHNRGNDKLKKVHICLSEGGAAPEGYAAIEDPHGIIRSAFAPGKYPAFVYYDERGNMNVLNSVGELLGEPGF